MGLCGLSMVGVVNACKMEPTRLISNGSAIEEDVGKELVVVLGVEEEEEEEEEEEVDEVDDEDDEDEVDDEVDEDDEDDEGMILVDEDNATRGVFIVSLVVLFMNNSC